jgi:ribulose-phosphate 3-epimerase
VVPAILAGIVAYRAGAVKPAPVAERKTRRRSTAAQDSIMTLSLASLPRDRLLAELSLWSADLARLADDIARVEPHTDLFHIDVSDAHFTPALLFFPDLVARIRKLTQRPLHVHLMTTADIVLEQITQFADAGADLLTVHGELGGALPAALDAIDARGIAAGLVLKLETPVADAAPWLDRVAMLTLLGTAIGVKGQGLSPLATTRLTEARTLIAGRKVLLAADGGIREHTVPDLRAAGADTVVMGSLAFGATDLATTMRWLQALPGR